MKMEQSVPKRRHLKFRRQGITQKKAYNIQDTAKVWNQEVSKELPDSETVISSAWLDAREEPRYRNFNTITR